MGYAKMTFAKLLRLKWLDLRQILPTDRPAEVDPPHEPHPDDLRSSYFYFTILRVMSAAMPPKPEKVINISMYFLNINITSVCCTK